MIRDYFDRLMHEVAEHPEVHGPADDDLSKRLKRNHESAQRDAIGRMKQFASWFTHGVPGGAVLRRAIFDAKRGAQVIDLVEAFFTNRDRTADADAPRSTMQSLKPHPPRGADHREDHKQKEPPIGRLFPDTGNIVLALRRRVFLLLQKILDRLAPPKPATAAAPSVAIPAFGSSFFAPSTATTAPATSSNSPMT